MGGVRMTRLAVVPGNSFDDLLDLGLGPVLDRYYNPCSFFEEVFFLSPFEAVERRSHGIGVIPTKDIDLPRRVRELSVDLVRGYGGATPSDIVVFHRAKGVPVIVSVHDKRPHMLRSSIRFADAVFVVSQELKGLVKAMGVREERIFVVLNGVDSSVMRPLDTMAVRDLTQRFPFKYGILHVGRKSPEKNIEAIIRALARLGPDYGLVAVGQGDPAAYQALAHRQGVEGRCVFLPGVPQPELTRFYNWASCVCHPSHSEAMCNVLLEALACGTPVVASSTALRGLGDIPSGAALSVEDPGDDEALAIGMRAACSDAVVRRRLQERARVSVAHLFLEKTQAHEIACYRQVLEMSAQGVFRRSLWDDAALSGADLLRRAGCRFKKSLVR